jgi:hypothetical protein
MSIMFGPRKHASTTLLSIYILEYTAFYFGRDKIVEIDYNILEVSKKRRFLVATQYLGSVFALIPLSVHDTVL